MCYHISILFTWIAFAFVLFSQKKNLALFTCFDINKWPQLNILLMLYVSLHRNENTNIVWNKSELKNNFVLCDTHTHTYAYKRIHPQWNHNIFKRFMTVDIFTWTILLTIYKTFKCEFFKTTQKLQVWIRIWFSAIILF